MPIPEDTVTAAASAESAPSAAPEKRARRDEAAQTSEKQPPPPSLGESEEPHPGERYLINVLGNARPGAAAAAASCCNGVGKAGMAAKAYSPYPNRGWLTGPRRFAPPRLRTHTKTSHQDSAKKAVRLSVHSGSNAPMLARWRTQASAAAAHPESSLPSQDSSSIRLSMTDFSGFLKSDVTTITTTALEAGEYMSMDAATAVADEKRIRLPPDDDDNASLDPYGWEAELESRVGVGIGMDMDVDVAVECCPVLHYRRAGGTTDSTKRSLLQRVLSLGPGGNANDKEG
jgi:hypothetical protein